MMKETNDPVRIRQQLGKASPLEVQSVIAHGNVETFKGTLMTQVRIHGDYFLAQMRRIKEEHTDIPRDVLVVGPTGNVAQWAEDAGLKGAQLDDVPSARFYLDFSAGMGMAIVRINAAALEEEYSAFEKEDGGLSLIDAAIEQIQKNPFKSVQAKEYVIAGAKCARDVYERINELAAPLYPQNSAS